MHAFEEAYIAGVNTCMHPPSDRGLRADSQASLVHHQLPSCVCLAWGGVW